MEDQKRKSVAALIVAKMKPKKEESEMSEELDGKAEAAQELMDAIKAGDSMAVADALQSFMEMCRSEED